MSIFRRLENTIIRFGIFSTKSGGCLVLVGLGKPEVSMPIVNAAVREVRLIVADRMWNGVV